MSLDSLNDILRRAKQELSSDEQLKLINELSLQAGKNGQRSILELKGLGKSVWEGIDADNYIGQERDAWTG